MESICPYCKKKLRVEMTSQFVEKVDPEIMRDYSEELERMQKRSNVQGRMFGGLSRMAAGMAKGMQGMMMRAMQGMIENPPMVTLLRCMECGAVLHIEQVSSGKSD